MKKIKVAILGYGYWGPNLVRNFNKLSQAEISAVVELDESKRILAKNAFPSLNILDSSDEILESIDIDAVIIATPPSTHFKLAKKALENNKHVLVEKPISQTSEESQLLVEIARKKHLTLMVDHTFIYSGAVRKIKEVIQSSDFGDLWYIDSVRINLGIIQKDVNVIWDLAPHDISILEFLLDSKPISVSAIALSPKNYIGAPLEGIGYLTIKYANGVLAHLHLSWLAPVKMRRMMLGGSKKLLVYDHLDPEHQVKIYDKAIDQHIENNYAILSERKEGDMAAPKIDPSEPLEQMASHFIECILTKTTPISDGMAGHRVVVLIEAAIKSIENSGIEIKI